MRYVTIAVLQPQKTDIQRAESLQMRRRGTRISLHRQSFNDRGSEQKQAHHRSWLAGIVDDMMGMTVGETRTIDQVVPDTWWENGLEEGLRGSKIQCDIQIRELFSWDLPEVRVIGAKAAAADNRLWLS